MKDELQLKMVEILTAIQSAVGKSADFAMEQLPDIAQQYVLYGRVWSTIAVLVSLAFLVTAVWAALRFGYLSKKTDYDGDWTEGRGFAAALGTVAAALAAYIFLYELRGAALVWLAPKVWLLKEVAGLLR